MKCDLTSSGTLDIEDELNIGRIDSLIGEDKTKELLWFHPKRT